jgi:hypothetical protein
MAPRRASGGVLRLFGCFILLSAGFQVPIDWGQSIYHLYPTHEKSVPGTEQRGSDRPEAYPTGNEKPEAYPTGNEKSEAYPTGNENRQADVELDRLILQEG